MAAPQDWCLVAARWRLRRDPGSRVSRTGIFEALAMVAGHELSVIARDQLRLMGAADFAGQGAARVKGAA